MDKNCQKILTYFIDGSRNLGFKHRTTFNFTHYSQIEIRCHCINQADCVAAVNWQAVSRYYLGLVLVINRNLILKFIKQSMKVIKTGKKDHEFHKIQITHRMLASGKTPLIGKIINTYNSYCVPIYNIPSPLTYDFH